MHLAIDARREEIEVVSVMAAPPRLFVDRFCIPACISAPVVVCWRRCVYGFSVPGWHSPSTPCLRSTIWPALRGPGAFYSVCLLAIGACLGWLAALIALRRYLRSLEI